jgi:hypothetical protein
MRHTPFFACSMALLLALAGHANGESVMDMAFPIEINPNGISDYAPVWAETQIAQVWNDYELIEDKYIVALHFTRWNLDGKELKESLRLISGETNMNFPGAFNAAAIWNGSEYAIAWAEGGEDLDSICFLRISQSGEKLAPTAVLRDPEARGLTKNLHIIWTGNGYSLTWETDQNPRVYLARIDSSGTQSEKPICLTTLTGYPESMVWAKNHCIVWNGNGYGFAWENYKDDSLYFSRFNAQGVELGEDQRIDARDRYSIKPVLAWSGKEYAVLWIGWNLGKAEDHRLYFTTIQSSGSLTGKPIILASDKNYIDDFKPFWDGEAFGLVWEQGKQNIMKGYFNRLDTSGKALISPVSILDSEWSSILSLEWTGKSNLVIWKKSAQQIGHDTVYLRFLDREGKRIEHK